ncbi:succinylglutamate desuccinylase, partial [Halobacteriales archaeon QS_1_68_44]
MRVETLGEGDPEVAVVGGIHGDEPCGSAAVEAVVEADPDVARPVKLIVANEEALKRGRRYVEEDLNRAFPGSPDADTHEGRLAHDLLTEIRGCEILSLHSTRSYAAPFALVDEMDGHARSICPYLSVEAVVETSQYSEGRLIAYPDVIELECGLQRSAVAAENARALVREFLVATGVLPGDAEPPRQHPLSVFCLDQRIPKQAADSYEVFVENFERVAEGEQFAAADG